VALPTATLTLEAGARYSWTSATTDVRALESPDGSERRATTWYDTAQLNLRLDFTANYTGTLHVYALDWDSTGRRQTISIADGTSTTVIPIAASFHEGTWLHVPISVSAGGSVLVTADHDAGYSATIAGLFLGGAVPSSERMVNTGFELDANGDSRPDGWTVNAAFVRSSAVVHGGVAAGRHASTKNVGYNVHQTAPGIFGGQSYAVGGWLNIPSTTDKFTFQLQLVWRGSGGNLRTDTIVSRTTATAGWLRMSGNATAPAGATSVRVVMKLKSLNATIYVDELSLFG
jgi:hypothetical protein